MRELADTIKAILSRCLLGPFTWIVPRDPYRFAVIGRANGMYVDNAKHFFAWFQDANRGNSRVVFHSDLKWVREAILRCGAEALPASGPTAWWHLLRSGTIIVDSSEWRQGGRIGATRGARIVQLWHGIALKEIEYALFQHTQGTRSALLRGLISISKSLARRFEPYDVLVSTSSFVTTQSLAKCIPAKSVVCTGYPRNDSMLRRWDELPELAKIGIDMAARNHLISHRSKGGMTLLYAPTFRQDKPSPFGADRFDLKAVASWASSVGAMIALKLHPSMALDRDVLDDTAIVWIDPASDVYPLLREIDVLITDYSSIYFDFLLLNRPIVFFPFDYDEYTTNDRRLLFDYEHYAPGPKAKNVHALVAALGQYAAGVDNWVQARTAVALEMHSHQDCRASERLLSYLNTTV